MFKLKTNNNKKTKLNAELSKELYDLKKDSKGVIIEEIVPNLIRDPVIDIAPNDPVLEERFKKIIKDGGLTETEVDWYLYTEKRAAYLEQCMQTQEEADEFDEMADFTAKLAYKLRNNGTVLGHLKS